MDPSQFLAALWGENPPGMVNVFTLPERKSSWYSELTSVNRDMQQHLHEEVYTGVALARNLGGRFNTQRRVKEVDAAAIPGVWADIDVFHQVHKKKENLPPTAEAAQEVMAELPYEPTLIVDSGHGIQAWWLLENPWVFSGQKEWEFVQVLRLLESFRLEEVHAAVQDALRLGALSFDAVKHLVLYRLEGRPPRLDLELYPHLPTVSVNTTSAGDYMALLSGRAA